MTPDASRVAEMNKFELDRSGPLPKPISMKPVYVMTKEIKAKFKTGEKMLELFPLRILALLVCRGTPEEKAGILYDLAAGSMYEYEEAKLSWNSAKLAAAIKMIFYFSEVLPK